MTEIMDLLYEMYISRRIEDETAMEYTRELYQGMTPPQTEQLEKLVEHSVRRSFLLGLQTGVGLERFLRQTPDQLF